MERFVPLEDFGRESFSASPRAWSTPASTYWLKPLVRGAKTDVISVFVLTSSGLVGLSVKSARVLLNHYP